jgi:hypothetical protein
MSNNYLLGIAIVCGITGFVMMIFKDIDGAAFAISVGAFSLALAAWRKK